MGVNRLLARGLVKTKDFLSLHVNKFLILDDVKVKDKVVLVRVDFNSPANLENSVRESYKAF